MKKIKQSIKKLDINLFPQEYTSEEEYKQQHAKYVLEYKEYVEGNREYHPGGLFSSGYYTGESGSYKSNPQKAELEWIKLYPHGYETWKGKQRELNAYGEQNIVDKINEIIDLLNK